jgi:hypothetical protein
VVPGDGTHRVQDLSDYTALDPLRYLSAYAFVRLLRVAIVGSISQRPCTTRPLAQTRRGGRTFLDEATKPATRTLLTIQHALLTQGGAIAGRLSFGLEPSNIPVVRVGEGPSEIEREWLSLSRALPSLSPLSQTYPL